MADGNTGRHGVRRSAAIAAFAAIGFFNAAPARAQGSREENADKLFKEALTAVAAGSYAEACPKFEES